MIPRQRTRSGIPRRINRRKFQREELDAILQDPGALPHRVFTRYQELLAVRRAQVAFHPDGQQQILPLQNPQVLLLLRTAPAGRAAPLGQQILVAANLSGTDQQVHIANWPGGRGAVDLLSNHRCEGPTLQLAPFQVVWLNLAGEPS